MHEELIKIIAIVLFVGILIYVVLKTIKFKSSLLEGFDPTSAVSGATGSKDYTTTNLGNVNTFAKNLEGHFNTSKAGLKINKDNVVSFHDSVIAFDDNVTILMINTFLNIDPNNITEAGLINVINKLNVLDAGKKSLNTLLKGIDFVSK
jgi:hypothetical protein